MEHKKPVLLIRCMDKRRTGALPDTLMPHYGKREFYQLTPPGGAGILADMNLHPEDRPTLLRWMRIAIDELGCEDVALSVHGIKEEGVKGCGGFCLSGFEDKYHDPAVCRQFSIEQLTRAAATTRSNFPNVKVRAFYIAIDKNGTNFAEEVDVS